MPAVSAAVRWVDVGADRSLPSASPVVQATKRRRTRARPAAGHAQVQASRGAREPERREHRTRHGGVHDDGDHAATATARARKHAGGEHPAQQLGPRDPACTRRAARRRGGGRWLAPARGHHESNLAPRSIYNIHSVVSAMFHDAKLADIIEQSPCVLDERHLGPLIDKDPEWRSSAVFTHEEAETIISDARIPPDRQMAYAIELLAGTRPGEASALRWRHYDPTVRPLGKLLVAKSYSTRVGEKTTKTDAVKHVPVHPTLAAMLAEWKLGGWAAMMGHAPARTT